MCTARRSAPRLVDVACSRLRKWRRAEQQKQWQQSGGPSCVPAKPPTGSHGVGSGSGRKCGRDKLQQPNAGARLAGFFGGCTDHRRPHRVWCRRKTRRRVASGSHASRRPLGQAPHVRSAAQHSTGMLQRRLQTENAITAWAAATKRWTTDTGSAILRRQLLWCFVCSTIPGLALWAALAPC